MLQGVGDQLTDRVQHRELVEHGDLQRCQPEVQLLTDLASGVGAAVDGRPERRERGRPVRGEQGDVVGVPGGPGQGLEGAFAHQGRPPRRGVRAAGRSSDGRPGELQRARRRGDPGSVGEAVGEQEEYVVGAEGLLARRVLRLRGQRSGAARLEEAGRAVRRDDERRRVSGRAVLDGAGGGIDHCDADRRRVRLGVQLGVPVQGEQRLVDRVVTQQALVENGAQLAHHGGRGDALADGVADHECDRPVRPEDGVEPVTTRSRAVCRQQVDRRDVQGRRHREVGREQGVLEVGHQVERRGVAGLRGLALGRKCCDVCAPADAAGDPAGLVEPRRDREVGVDPLARTSGVHLPAVEVVGLPGPEDLVEEVEHRLAEGAGQRGGHRLADRVAVADERPQARVAGHDAQLGAARDELQIGTLLEPDGLGLFSARVCHKFLPRSGLSWMPLLLSRAVPVRGALMLAAWPGRSPRSDREASYFLFPASVPLPHLLLR